MKLNTTPILAASFAIVTVFLGLSLTGVIDTNNSMNQIGTAQAYMTGHVETVVRDSDGNIKEYRQSDNVIVNRGENCVAKLLFENDGTGAGLGSNIDTGNGCTGSLNQPWTAIVLGNNTDAATGLQNGLGLEHRGNSLIRSTGTVSFTNATTSANASTDRAVITIAKTFTNNSAGTNTVSESGLFNSTTVGAGGMFARQQFNTITLSGGDSLTVTWSINIGNAATFTTS